MAVPTVVLVPVWGAGHLMSMLDAGKRLLTRGGRALSLTVLVIPPPPMEELVADLDAHIRREEASGLAIRFVRLPTVQPPTDFRGIEDFVSRLVQLHAPDVRAAISSLASPVAAFVVDFFCTTLFDVSRELAVPSYVYFTANAGMLALMLRLPSLHEEVTVQFEEMEGAVDVPGLPPVPPSSLPNPVMDKNSPNYTWFVYHGRRFAEADGIIVNTAAELEQSVLAAIADGRCKPGVRAPTVYPIGPVISFTPPAEQPHVCVRWLDTQPPASVVLLCFGSVAAGARDRARPGAQRPPLPLGAARPTATRRAPPVGREPHRAAPRGLPREDQGQRPGLADEGAAERDTGPRRRGGFRDTLRLELGPREPVVRRAVGAVAAVRRAAPERVHLVAYMGVAVAMKVDRKRNNFLEAVELERAVKELMGSGEEGRKAREKAIEMRGACRNAVEEGGSSYAALRRLSEEMGKVDANH